MAPPAGADVMVGGSSAGVADQLHSLSSRQPRMALLINVIVLLAIAFGSLMAPIKAIVMNLLSIGASYLAGLLHFTPTGHVEASRPILVMAILFSPVQSHLGPLSREWAVRRRVGDYNCPLEP